MTSLLARIADSLDPTGADGSSSGSFYCWKPECDGMPHDGFTYRHARAKQHPPLDDWFIWLIRAGRGYGKTRTGAEWLADKMSNHPQTYWAAVAPTYDDGRDLMIEGESGLESVLDRRKITHEWNRSLGHLILGNSARLDLFSSEKPESLRGPNLSGAWGDEPASWKRPEVRGGQPGTWDNLLLMCRKGQPQILLTGTPKPTKFYQRLIAQANHVTDGSSMENRYNLADAWFDSVIAPLQGTRLGMQEVEGKVIEDVEGALWLADQFDAVRSDPPDDLTRCIVSVDPSVTGNEDSDECGIIVGGSIGEHCWILEDLSIRAHPRRWAEIVVAAYHAHQADYVVAEANNGGDLVEVNIQAVDPRVPVKKVHAARGKRPRAEPVATLYGDRDVPSTWAKSRVHHSTQVSLAALESQMYTWDSTDPTSKSPDRLDAAVWLVTELLLGSRGRGGLRA